MTSARTAWDEEIPYSMMYPPNMTVDWLDTDSPENAQYEKDIKYTFNEYGFRSDPFYDRKDLNIVAIGCSMTVGVGVDQHENWPNRVKHKLQEQTGLSVSMWNLATSGASTDYATRMAFKVRHKLKPDAIMVYWPPITRLEVPTPHEGKITQASIHMELFPKQLVDEDYLIYNYNRNLNFLKSIVKHNPAALVVNPLVETFAQHQMYKGENPFIADTDGRDGQHPGPEWHDRVADWYVDQWINHPRKPLQNYLDNIDK